LFALSVLIPPPNNAFLLAANASLLRPLLETVPEILLIPSPTSSNSSSSLLPHYKATVLGL